jgi:hypothetical protein
MPAALLALLLVASTVAPRLEEPVRVLAEVRDRDGEPVRAECGLNLRHANAAADECRPGRAAAVGNGEMLGERPGVGPLDVHEHGRL